MNPGRRGSRRKVKKNKPIFPIAIGVVLLVVLGAVFIIFFEWGDPVVTLHGDVSRLGLSEEIGITVTDAKCGIRTLDVYFEQDGNKYELLKKRFIRQDSYPYSGPKKIDESRKFKVKSLGLDEGDATLIVHVRDFSLWGGFEGNEVKASYPVIIDTRPPVVRIKRKPVNIRPGSAGVVVYKANEPLMKHGVFINGFFHPGYALPSHGKNAFGATIGIPYNSKNITSSYVMAVDLNNNESQASFGVELRSADVKSDRINITDNFLDRKVPEFLKHYPNIPGTFLEKYIYINNKVRAENNKKIREVCSKSVPEKLWNGSFGRLAGSARRSNFGDRRTYYYHDRPIDKQTHLGVDLASVHFAEVQAANRGKVVFADYLGIYGNTVILDHGLGVFSLYSHLSQTSVVLGDIIEKDSILGLTGKTGMAGGDHLHYSMLINGVFVDPVEWWDAKWLSFHISNLL